MKLLNENISFLNKEQKNNSTSILLAPAGEAGKYTSNAITSVNWF